jgi:hypothetical protein
LADVVNVLRRIGPVLFNAGWTRVPALGFVAVALRAERHYLIVPDLLDVSWYVLVVIIAVTGHYRAFPAAPGADGEVPGFVCGRCFYPLRGSPYYLKLGVMVVDPGALGVGAVMRGGGGLGQFESPGTFH